MDYQNQQVFHKRFGQGGVQRIEGDVIHVYFQQYGARAFRYPEAFDVFLRAEDKDFAAVVRADLERWKEEQRTKDVEIQLKLEAEIGEARMMRKRTATTRDGSAKTKKRTTKKTETE